MCSVKKKSLPVDWVKKDIYLYNDQENAYCQHGVRSIEGGIVTMSD